MQIGVQHAQLGGEAFDMRGPERRQSVNPRWIALETRGRKKLRMTVPRWTDGACSRAAELIVT